MAREITMEELLAQQRALVDRAAALVGEKDVDKIQALTAQLLEAGRALEAQARAFEEQELAKAGPPPRGAVEVVLTEAQRRRVRELTGVELTSVVLPDEMGLLNKAMPTTDPREIERWAIAEARRQAARRGADEVMRAELERALLDIEQQGTGEVQRELERLRADPNWLGGLLRK